MSGGLEPYTCAIQRIRFARIARRRAQTCGTKTDLSSAKRRSTIGQVQISPFIDRYRLTVQHETNASKPNKWCATAALCSRIALSSSAPTRCATSLRICFFAVGSSIV